MYATVGRILYATWRAAMPYIEETNNTQTGGPCLVVTGSTINTYEPYLVVTDPSYMSRSCVSQTLATYHYVTYPGRTGQPSSGIIQA